MSWKTQAGTRHASNCRMRFGRKDPECPRCQELLAGSPPRTWGGTVGYVGGRALNRQQMDAHLAREIEEHFQSEKHRTGGCGPVCTFGEW